MLRGRVQHCTASQSILHLWWDAGNPTRYVANSLSEAGETAQHIMQRAAKV